MRGKQIACCFTGHRPSKLPWGDNESDPRCVALKERIAHALETAYEDGFRHFISGMALGCDLYFCQCALALRNQYPEVTVEAAIPCPEQPARWSQAQQTHYAHLVAQCDFETVISQHYARGCMQRRNRYMVDHASLLIAAFDGSTGGTQSTILYAMNRGISIVDLSIVLADTPQ